MLCCAVQMFERLIVFCLQFMVPVMVVAVSVCECSGVFQRFRLFESWEGSSLVVVFAGKGGLSKLNSFVYHLHVAHSWAHLMPR